ncbi:MAG: Ig-like domain-containing protein [Bacteroidaceae bacterium]|nr:Ig-like domain-containing protein [Bacteroidaceae bacterium]
MKHNQLTLMLAVLMRMVAISASAANYDVEVNGAYFYCHGYGAVVTYASYNGPNSTTNYWNYNGYYEGDIVIPESIAYEGKAYTVVEIGECAFRSTGSRITSLTIPKTVRKIGDGAFEGCTIPDIYCYSIDPPQADKHMAFVESEYTGFRKGSNGIIKSSTSSYSSNHLYIATLHVPKESVEKYKTSYPWAYFDSICAIPDPVESLKLEKHNLTLNVEKSETLKYEILPTYADNQNVIWSSSDETVATVSEGGMVTANNEGTCHVIATSEDNPEAADTCVITVIRPVTGVTLSHSEYTLNGVGSAFDLKANVLPENATNKNVKWFSSKESVCTVSNAGRVTAVGEGQSTITVKSEDGGHTATCKVTVVVEHPVTGVVLNHDAYTLEGIGKSVQLVATIHPENADNKEVTWKSYNESVCVVSNGLVVAVGQGTAMVSVTTTDGNHMAFCTITVTDGTSIGKVSAKEAGYKVFDLQGVEYPSLQKGLNIIRFSDGTSQKVFIK